MLSRLKISQKLTGGFGLLIAITLLANLAVFWNLNTIKSQAEANDRTYDRSIEVQTILRGLVEQQNAVRGYVISGGAESFAITYREQAAATDKALESFIANTASAEQKALGEKLQRQFAEWRPQHADRPMILAADPATRGQAMQILGSASLGDLRKTVDAMATSQDQIQDERMRAQEQAISTALFIFLISSAAAVLTAVALSFAASRMIVTPVAAMTNAMRRLAGGDHSIEIPGRGRKDELGEMADAVQVFKEAAGEKLRLEAEAKEQARLVEAERAEHERQMAEEAAQDAIAIGALAKGLSLLASGDLTHRITEEFHPKAQSLKLDFNAAMDKLQDAMKVITGATQGLRSGADEISQAADDLSKRTEQQAASLEETAAALDEITATVRKTAEGAHHARDVVSTAKNDAEHSGQVVRDAVAAMSEIEKSAQQISQIIGVIDEIAFQTNLLALNAGVEAARAGDAGKGFAVVASEVRALAQRSADAAKEIKALISASTQQVGQGVALVGETGEALTRIVAQVAEINNVVSEIAASAQEQATGLNQVNTAVNQMDQVTQQNAAMVEQSTAASHSLAQETEELARLVSRFQVGEVGAQSPVRREPRAAAAPAAPAPQRTVAALKNVSTHAGGGGALPKAQPVSDLDSWEEF